jgi:hypothetical protein
MFVTFLFIVMVLLIDPFHKVVLVIVVKLKVIVIMVKYLFYMPDDQRNLHF